MNRQEMITYLLKVADPVIQAGAKDTLKEKLPCYSEERREHTYFEAVGRLILGIAPWLIAKTSDSEEQKLQEEYGTLCIKMIRNQLDPKAKDYANFDTLAVDCSQTIVDIAFLVQGIFRAKSVLFDKMDDECKKMLLDALLLCREAKVWDDNNWLLFSAYIETAIYLMTGDCDLEKVKNIILQFDNWYVGDGFYGDGPLFAMDYYNSYVIQPMLCEIVEIFENILDLPHNAAHYWNYLSRYAQIQERMIAADGTYFVIGRSSAYRVGAFQALALAALRKKLPVSLPPSQVRCALSSVIEKTLGKDSFDENGYLQVGICAYQPAIGEEYISTGSLYLCSGAFLPLGLSDNDKFWTEEDLPWTQKRIWNGENVRGDYRID